MLGLCSEHSAAKKKTPTCIPGLELKDPIDGQRHRLTDATLDQRDHPHGRRKGSAFAVLEASATHAGAAKFWKLVGWARARFASAP